MQHPRERIRIKIDVSKSTPLIDVLTSSTPDAWVSTDLQFELAVFYGDTILDISNFDSIRIEVKPSDNRLGVAFMDKTVLAADLNPTVTEDDWNTGIDQHAIVPFAHAETDLDMDGSNTKDFWLVISAMTTDAPTRWITLGAGAMKFLQDGTPSASDGPIQGGNIVPSEAEYDGSGHYVVTVTANKVYRWAKGANDTSITNGLSTVTDDGIFTTEDTTITLNGTPSTPVTATIRSEVYLTADESDARYLGRGIRWLGPYDNGTDYITGDAVSYQGSSWRKRRNSAAGVTPPTLPTESNADWEVIAEKGDTGGDGTDGDAAFSTTAAGFTMPAVDATVTVQVDKSGWMSVGQNVFVTSAGEFEVTAKPDGTHVTIKNLGYSGNASPAASIGSAKQISPSGKQGSQGEQGITGDTGSNAFTPTTASFVMPAANASVTIEVEDTTWMGVGQYIFIETAGYFSVTSVIDETDVTITNLGYDVNAGAGTTISTAVKVSPGGVKGAAGNSGDMILAATQTNTGAKTFSDNTLRLRNSGATASVTVRTDAIIDRTVAFPDKSGAPLIEAHSALAYAGGVTIDFSADCYRTISLSGDVAFSAVGMALMRWVRIRVVGDSTERALTFPANWRFLNDARPASLAADNIGVLTAFCYGGTESDVVAIWEAEGGANSAEVISITDTGTHNIAPDGHFESHAVLANISEAYSPYTHLIVLKTDNATEGDEICIRLEFPASVDQTIEVRNDTTIGTLLTTFVGQSSSVAIPAYGLYRFVDGEWREFDAAFID